MNVFNDKIEAHIASRPYQSWERPTNRHWPSEATYVKADGTAIGKCLREQWFIRNKYPVERKIAAHHIRKMETGKSIEQNEIAHAKEVGIWVEDNVSLLLDVGDMVVSGKVDAIYMDDAGNRVLVEYKTSSGYRFEKEVYGRYSRLRAEPRPENVLQVLLYLEAFKDIPYAILYYINRDKMDVIEHMVSLKDGRGIVNGVETEFTIDGICARYRELTGYLDTNTVPPCDYSPTYTSAEVEELKSTKQISEKAYKAFKNDDVSPAHWRCNLICGFKERCLEEEGVKSSTDAYADGYVWTEGAGPLTAPIHEKPTGPLMKL